MVWSHRRGSPEIPSPLVHNNLIFFTNEGGVVSCLESKTGNKVWKGRVGGNHWASPILAGERIYFFNQEGEISVISAGREFQLLAENELNASFIASPAVVEDTMILRSTTDLYYLANGFERVVSKDEASPRRKVKKEGKGKRQGKNDDQGSKSRGKIKSRKGQASVRQQVEGWTNYFRTASEQQIR